MTEVCAIVRYEAGDLLNALGVTPDGVRADSPETCDISSDDYVIHLECDLRDGGVFSNITIKKMPIGNDIDYPTPAVSAFFKEITTKDPYSEQDISERIKLEIQNITSTVLMVNELDSKSLRDLYFFLDGYIEGYNHQYS